MIDIQKTFEKCQDNYLKFKDLENKLHSRPDICAFLLIDKLLPSNNDIVSAAEHDVIYLDCDIEELSKVATEEDILMLCKCGVIYDSDYDCLSMFV